MRGPMGKLILNTMDDDIIWNQIVKDFKFKMFGFTMVILKTGRDVRRQSVICVTADRKLNKGRIYLWMLSVRSFSLIN